MGCFYSDRQRRRTGGAGLNLERHGVETVVDRREGRGVVCAFTPALGERGGASWRIQHTVNAKRRLDEAGRARLRAADAELIDRIGEGDAAGFWDANQAVDDRYNVCGMSPIYLALRLLGPALGECLDYALCPADEAGTSAVSICGMVLEPR